MDAAASGLMLCLLGAVLARRDIRGIIRRRAWSRAEAVIRYQPGDAGPSWSIEFSLPDGRPVHATTRDQVLRDEG